MNFRNLNILRIQLQPFYERKSVITSEILKNYIPTLTRESRDDLILEIIRYK